MKERICRLGMLVVAGVLSPAGMTAAGVATITLGCACLTGAYAAGLPTPVETSTSAALAKPTPGLVTFQNLGLGLFVHWSPCVCLCWNTVNVKEGEMPAEGAGTRDGNQWAPAECDVSILRPNWFWSRGSDQRVLSLAALTEIYYLSMGRSANLLLNITPDDHGAIPEAQMKRLAEFGEDIRARFGQPLATMSGTLTETTGSLVLTLGGQKMVDHVRLREDIRGGERVRTFQVMGRRPDGAWSTLTSGSQIGARQIIPFAPIVVTEVKLSVIESVAPASVVEFSVFHVDRPVPALAYRKGLAE